MWRILGPRRFFIVLALMSRCTSGADEADNPTALGEVDQEKAAPGRVAHDDFSALPFGMEWIVVDPRQRIAEYGESFLE